MTYNTLPKNTLLTEKEIQGVKGSFDFIEVYISFSGIKKRCRKKTNHLLTLGYIISDDNIDFNEITISLHNNIRNIISDYKSINNHLKLNFRYSHRNDDYCIEFMIFDERNIEKTINSENL